MYTETLLKASQLLVTEEIDFQNGDESQIQFFWTYLRKQEPTTKNETDWISTEHCSTGE